MEYSEPGIEEITAKVNELKEKLDDLHAMLPKKSEEEQDGGPPMDDDVDDADKAKYADGSKSMGKHLLMRAMTEED